MSPESPRPAFFSTALTAASRAWLCWSSSFARSRLWERFLRDLSSSISFTKSWSAGGGRGGVAAGPGDTATRTIRWESCVCEDTGSGFRFPAILGARAFRPLARVLSIPQELNSEVLAVELPRLSQVAERKGLGLPLSGFLRRGFHAIIRPPTY